MQKIKLKPHREISVLKRHRWIFSGAIENSVKSLNDGDLVEVYSANNVFLAVGYFTHADISIRILSFTQEQIDTEFYYNVLISAFDYRKALIEINSKNQIFRLIHGEADGIPGLIIDVYGDVVVVQTHNSGMDLQCGLIKKALKLFFDASEVKEKLGSREKVIVEKKAGRKRETEQRVEESACQLVAGAPVYENNYKFHIDPETGQKTGFFIDQRDNRKIIESVAKDKTVLDAFCYSGGFSVYALGGGAKEVVSLDASKPAIELVSRNVAENFPNINNHETKTTDCFDYLENPDREFDLIILDPPAFAKHRNAVQSALRGYEMINSQAMKVIKDGGLIATFSCSQLVTKPLFLEMLGKAAARSGREVKLIKELGQAVCHPINPCHVEGEYLKGWLLYVPSSTATLPTPHQ